MYALGEESIINLTHDMFTKMFNPLELFFQQQQVVEERTNNIQDECSKDIQQKLKEIHDNYNERMFSWYYNSDEKTGHNVRKKYHEN